MVWAGELGMNSLRSFLALALALGIAAVCAAAQQSRSSLPDTPSIAATDVAAGGVIQGRVVSKDGEVYAGVRVELTSSGPKGSTPGSGVRVESTDDDGRFRFSGVAPGPFRIRLTSPGFAAQQFSGALGAGQTLDTADIVLTMSEASSDVVVSASPQGIAQEQLNVEIEQRVFGVIPNFYVAYDQNAAPLSTRQKYELAWKSNLDPVTWAATGFLAGVEQASNTFPGYGQGAQGYGKRFGALYADGFIGDLLGSALFPSIFKQDPRYFYKGTGSIRSRAWWAIYNSFMCKGDNGRLQVDYSALMGSLAAAGVSNLYYPAADRNGAALTFESTGIGIGFSAAENLAQEFIVKKLTPHAGRAAHSQP